MPYADLDVRRECNRKKNLVYRKTRKYKVRAKIYASDPKRKIMSRAGRAVFLALRKGILKRLPCNVCGLKKTESHHSSYLEKDYLKIDWLCKLHHEEWHTKNKPTYPL